MVHHALRGVFNRNHPILRPAPFHFQENVLQGGPGNIGGGTAELLEGRNVGVGTGLAEISYFQPGFQGQGPGHDLAKNVVEDFRWKRPLIKLGNPLVDFLFAVGRVKMKVALGLDGFDFKDIVGAVVQQLDQLGIDPIDGVTELFEVVFARFHVRNPGRFYKMCSKAGLYYIF